MHVIGYCTRGMIIVGLHWKFSKVQSGKQILPANKGLYRDNYFDMYINFCVEFPNTLSSIIWPLSSHLWHGSFSSNQEKHSDLDWADSHNIIIINGEVQRRLWKRT